MNLIRRLAERIIRKAPDVHTPEIYSVSNWIVQLPPIVLPHFQFSDVLVSNNPRLLLTEGKPSTNLLPQTPKVHNVSELLSTPEVLPHIGTRIVLPEVTDSTNCLIEPAICSNAYTKTLTVPETFLLDIADFEVSVLARQEHFLVSLNVVQVLEESFVAFNTLEILACCFKQNDCERKSEQHQESFEGQKNDQESKAQILSQPPSYCQILYPILLPPLSLESHNELDFYNPLRDYQKQGIKFLFDSPSALLADEMGTGKTVQAVNALRLLFRQGYIKSALVVCPPAVIGSVDLSIKTGNSEGWSGHFYHWASELQIVVMHGVKRDQRKANWHKPFHVYITTYNTLRGDLSDGILADLQQFDCIILDEAQKIKNRGTKIAKAVRRLEADYRWALTGTPIENRLDDVISLFDFIRLGTFLGGVKYSPQDVSSLIKPFMRRRLKKDVLQQLPEKEYVPFSLELDQQQRVDYDHAIEAAREKIKTVLNGEQRSQVKLHIFALLPKLKQICNFAEGQSQSPKAHLLLELLETIAANKKRCLSSRSTLQKEHIKLPIC